MQQKNYLLFFVLSFLLFMVWLTLQKQRPLPKLDQDNESPLSLASKAEATRIVASVGQTGGLGQLWQVGWTAINVDKRVAPLPAKPVQRPTPRIATPDDQLEPLTLGSAERTSDFHLKVVFDLLGAGVRSVVLNKFQQTNLNDDLCEPMWQKDEDGKFLLDDKGHKIPVPLELVTAALNRENPSHLLFLFDQDNPADSRPLDTLGKRNWKVDRAGIEGNAGYVRKDETKDKKKRQSITFTTEQDGLTVSKTYSLVEGEYHIGLEVKLALSDAGIKGRERTIRYQLTGAHGLPIEGKWYTSTFRNALIAEEEKGQREKSSIWREFQDLRQMSSWSGGDKVKRQQNRMIRYAGVAVQYFASVIVVDNEQKDQDFLDAARPTLESAVMTGMVKSIDSNERSFVLTTSEPRDPEQTLYLLHDVEDEQDLTVGQKVTVLYYTDSKQRKIATFPAPGEVFQPFWDDDVTVRVTTESQKLAPGESITNRYLLYNGPVKPRLLRQQSGAATVDEAVVKRYEETLHLNTLTDYGKFMWWTDIIIVCTNLMHWVLGGLYSIVPNYGLCIILLTIMVRGMMFPLSRKQALTTMKMQALAPELKKMQEKYKDDKQALMQEQFAIYRKHKINPFGTCWLLLLQMPVFMGLYFAFQESINFRLASFWPTWIINLAAPDMLLHWGHHIPWISRPQDYGATLLIIIPIYLGPCFNLLPVLAMALMIAQQKLMTPPPTDDQQAMQQKMMKYMMIVFGLVFYKVAAGLCVYFIASSLWAFAERKLLPKSSLKGIGPADNSRDQLAPAGKPSTSVPATAVAGADGARKNKQGRNRKKERAGGNAEEESTSALGRFRNWFRKRRQRLRDWWIEVLKQAEKK